MAAACFVDFRAGPTHHTSGVHVIAWCSIMKQVSQTAQCTTPKSMQLYLQCLALSSAVTAELRAPHAHDMT